MQEKSLGQKFVVDATLYANLEKAGRSGRLDDTVNYAEVYEYVSCSPSASLLVGGKPTGCDSDSDSDMSACWL